MQITVTHDLVTMNNSNRTEKLIMVDQMIQMKEK